MPGVYEGAVGLMKACRFRKSQTITSPALRTTADQETSSLVVRFVREGLVTGPRITATGGLSKFPALASTELAGGGAVCSVNGTVNGTTIPPPGGGGARPIAWDRCTVPYFRGSGATRPTVNTTSASVGYASVTFPDRRTDACFGTGSSYVRTARSEIGTAACSRLRARSRSAWVGADAITVSVIVRAA